MYTIDNVTIHEVENDHPPMSEDELIEEDLLLERCHALFEDIRSNAHELLHLIKMNDYTLAACRNMYERVRSITNFDASYIIHMVQIYFIEFTRHLYDDHVSKINVWEQWSKNICSVYFFHQEETHALPMMYYSQYNEFLCSGRRSYIENLRQMLHPKNKLKFVELKYIYTFAISYANVEIMRKKNIVGNFTVIKTKN